MMTLVLAAAVAATARPCVQVEGDRVRAADLAAAVAAVAALPPDLELGYAPVPGVRRTIGAAELTRLARAAAPDARFTESVCVERRTLRLEPAALIAAMRRGLGRQEATIEVLDHTRLAVPAGELEFPRSGLSAPPPAAPDSPVRWRGQIRYGPSRTFAIWALVRVKAPVRRAVATAPIAAGRPLTDECVRMEDGFGFPQESPEVLGHIARRAIPAGTAITASMVEAPQEVERGDRVMAEVRLDGLVLRVDALAETAGRRGDIVRVKNVASGKKFSARVEAKGKVLAAR